MPWSFLYFTADYFARIFSNQYVLGRTVCAWLSDRSDLPVYLSVSLSLSLSFSPTLHPTKQNAMKKPIATFAASNGNAARGLHNGSKHQSSIFYSMHPVDDIQHCTISSVLNAQTFTPSKKAFFLCSPLKRAATVWTVLPSGVAQRNQRKGGNFAADLTSIW